MGPVTGAIYRISSDGAWDLVWELREDTPYDLAFEGNGNLLVATGNKGKIYRLSGEPFQPTLVVRANVQQVTSILSERDGRMLLATSNPSCSACRRCARSAALHLRRATADRRGLGHHSLAGSGSGGHGSSLDAVGQYPYAGRDLERLGACLCEPVRHRYTSPRARYLQWRAILAGAKGESPLLTSVSAAYLPATSVRASRQSPSTARNRLQRPFPTDPEIAGFDGDLPDRRNAATTPGSPPNLGRRVYQKGLRLSGGGGRQQR